MSTYYIQSVPEYYGDCTEAEAMAAAEIVAAAASQMFPFVDFVTGDGHHDFEDEKLLESVAYAINENWVRWISAPKKTKSIMTINTTAGWAVRQRLQDGVELFVVCSDNQKYTLHQAQMAEGSLRRHLADGGTTYAAPLQDGVRIIK